MAVKFTLTEAEQAAILAAREKVIAPYRKLAEAIADTVAKGKTLNERAGKERSTLWGEFKDGMAIAAKEGHNPGQLRDGLSLACAEKEVPGGSFRSYVATIGDLYNLVQAGKLKLDAAMGLKIAEARTLVMPDERRQLAELKERFREITADYTLSQWVDLVTLIAPAAEESEGEEEAVAPVQPERAAA